MPPSIDAKQAALPRDLIVLLDASGSMSGSPLDQARRVTAALVDSLTEQDQLELIEFSSSPRRWRGAVYAPRRTGDAQPGWRGCARAAAPMKAGSSRPRAARREQRQVILITDGQIG